MELYILDSLYRRVRVIDQFISCIWTENFRSKGDFELDVVSTLENVQIFKAGVKLAMNKSYRVMIIEKIQDLLDDEGRKILKVTGFSLESILEHRGIYGATFNGEPKDIADSIFHEVCVTGWPTEGDIIPSVTEANIFEPDTIAFPPDSVDYTIEFMTVYKALTDLCDIYGMGFRLVRDLDTSMLYFDVYMGSDRTTAQTGFPAVVFAPNLDNLRNTQQVLSVEAYKNVAYVISPVGSEIVYDEGVSEEVEGFERRALIINATDITDEDPEVATALMIQKGKEELAKAKQVQVLDGELGQNTTYVYGTDYNLGDLVELRDANGTTSKMQVTQQIFAQDAEGERAYPTLAVNLFIYPGSWLAWDFNQVWEDLTDEEWADLE